MAPGGASRKGSGMSCIEHPVPLGGVNLRVPRRFLRPALALLLVGLLAVTALRSRSVLAPLRDLHAPQSGWLALTLLAELCALVAYAAIVRRLLALGGV